MPSFQGSDGLSVSAQLLTPPSVQGDSSWAGTTLLLMNMAMYFRHRLKMENLPTMRFMVWMLSLVLFASVLMATERHAWGYVDPGSGLFLLQGFASVTAAVTYFFRRRLRALFAVRRTDRKLPDAKHDPQQAA